MRSILIIILLLITTQVIFSQKINLPEWSQFSKQERELKVYEKDSTASAVVLSEIGYTYVENENNFNLIKEYYVRIKILNKEGFKQATIEIPTYKKAKIKNIKASTTNFSNGKKTVYLDESNIFRTKSSENWSLTSFTLPAIEVGSIIEYSYIENTPYRFNFANGWIFQSDIPKVRSIYHAKIPGFWQYHISTVSLPNIKPQEHRLISDCLIVNTTTASCLYLKYSLTDIPAFIEEEYMTSKYNFLQQIKFELKSFTNTRGEKTFYSKKWKNVDREFFTDYDVGKKYGKKSYIKDNIPQEIYAEKDSLEKAKKVFQFIKNQLNWNGKYQLFKDFDLKKSWKKKVGNMAEINVHLANALKATGIKASLTLLSTRDNGLPIKLHPVISDFNYLVVHIRINGKNYFLDAVDKKMPFGMLPYKCLNGEMRVFDKKEGSYWLNYTPIKNSSRTTYTSANLSENAVISLKSRIVYKGYKALDKRKEILETSKQSYKEKFEEKHEDLSLTNHKIKGLNEFEKPLIETFELQKNPDAVSGNTIYFKPFLINPVSKNPFTLNKRQYPVDMGYQRSSKFNLVFTIPDNYEVKSLPKSRKIVIPKKGGSFTYLINSKSNKIKINFNFSLKKTKYSPIEYQGLKELYTELITAQNEMIILTKK